MAICCGTFTLPPMALPRVGDPTETPAWAIEARDFIAQLPIAAAHDADHWHQFAMHFADQVQNGTVAWPKHIWLPHAHPDDAALAPQLAQILLELPPFTANKVLAILLKPIPLCRGDHDAWLRHGENPIVCVAHVLNRILCLLWRPALRILTDIVQSDHDPFNGDQHMYTGRRRQLDCLGMAVPELLLDLHEPSLQPVGWTPLPSDLQSILDATEQDCMIQMLKNFKTCRCSECLHNLARITLFWVYMPTSLEFTWMSVLKTGFLGYNFAIDTNMLATRLESRTHGNYSESTHIFMRLWSNALDAITHRVLAVQALTGHVDCMVTNSLFLSHLGECMATLMPHMVPPHIWKTRAMVRWIVHGLGNLHVMHAQSVEAVCWTRSLVAFYTIAVYNMQRRIHFTPLDIWQWSIEFTDAMFRSPRILHTITNDVPAWMECKYTPKDDYFPYPHTGATADYACLFTRTRTTKYTHPPHLPGLYFSYHQCMHIVMQTCPPPDSAKTHHMARIWPHLFRWIVRAIQQDNATLLWMLETSEFCVDPPDAIYANLMHTIMAPASKHGRPKDVQPVTAAATTIPRPNARRTLKTVALQRRFQSSLMMAIAMFYRSRQTVELLIRTMHRPNDFAPRTYPNGQTGQYIDTREGVSIAVHCRVWNRLARQPKPKFKIHQARIFQDSAPTVLHIDPEAACGICLSPPTDPVCSVHCTHVFCEQCISHWRHVRNVCPFCRHPIQRTVSADLTRAAKRRRGDPILVAQSARDDPSPAPNLDPRRPAPDYRTFTRLAPPMWSITPPTDALGEPSFPYLRK